MPVYGQIIAETYDDQYQAARSPCGDQAFYLGLARETGGPVLEIGCGTGRVLRPIAEAGIEAVGVDPSEAMLARFRAGGLPEGLTLVAGRAETLDLDRRDFGLATFPFRAFMHLETVEQQLSALRRVRAHLRPGGWLALDVFDPDIARMGAAREEGTEAPFTWRGRQVQRSYAVTRDHARQLQQVRFDYLDASTGEALGDETIAMRWTWRFELEHLLVRAGFTPLRWSSDYTGGPYTGAGDIVVVAARTAG